MTGHRAELWPRYAGPEDLAVVEQVPLTERGLPATTYEIVRRAAQLGPHESAHTVFPEASRWREATTRSFGDLLGEVHRVANQFHGLGARRHTAIALLSPNCADLLTALLAAEVAGIAAPLNPDLSGDHLRELLDRSGARIVACASADLDAKVWDTVLELDAEARLDAVVLLRPTGFSDVRVPAGLRARVEVIGVGEGLRSDGFDGTLPSADDLAAVFHTGGTTGVPKLAAHTHANQVADAWMVASYSGGNPRATVFAGLPLFHVNALIVTTLGPLLRGQHGVWAGPQGYRDPHLYGQFWSIVEHHRIGMMSAVPTVYAVLAACPVDADISSLKVAAVGAAPLPPSVAEGFLAATGCALAEGYGLTEATCASSRNFPDAPRLGTVGQRLAHQQVKAVQVEPDGTWQDVGPGARGVLAISGPTVFAGYVVGRNEQGFVLDPLGTVRTDPDGRRWLLTGDLGEVAPDGYLRLVGREKDLIIRGGHNLDPAPIEDALLSHPAVAAAGVVGAPDPHAGEVPVGFVALAPDASVSEEELVSWAAERVGERAAAPRWVEVIDAVPLTAVGKPFKPALRVLATRRAVVEALAGVAPAEAVQVELAGGVPAVRVTVAAADRAAVRAVMDRFAIGWGFDE